MRWTPTRTAKSASGLWVVFSDIESIYNIFVFVREWLLAVCICRKGTHDEKLAWTFRLYDTDGSGSIDFEEVTTLTCRCPSIICFTMVPYFFMAVPIMYNRSQYFYPTIPLPLRWNGWPEHSFHTSRPWPMRKPPQGQRFSFNDNYLRDWEWFSIL